MMCATNAASGDAAYKPARGIRVGRVPSRGGGRLSVVESVVSANLQRATRLRQSILQRAFTGGLV